MPEFFLVPPFQVLKKFGDVVWHVSWSVTGNILAVSGGDNKVSLYDKHCFKKLQLSQSCEHRLNYQLSAFTRKFFKLRYPINTKIFAEYERLNLDKKKNDHF